MNSALTSLEIVKQLNQANQAHVSKIVRYVNDQNQSSSNKKGSNDPVLDKLYASEKWNEGKAITGFTSINFDKI